MNLERLSYAQSLRAIGASLEARGIDTFDLEKYDDTYMLRLMASQPATGGSFLKKFAQLLWRTDNSSRGPSHPADTTQTLRYTLLDISRLVAEQQSRHDGLNVVPDAYKIAQVLRVVGDRLDRKEARVFKVSVSGHSVSVTYEPKPLRQQTKFSRSKVYTITLFRCICAGRNDLKRSPNSHAKSLYRERGKKPECPLRSPSNLNVR